MGKNQRSTSMWRTLDVTPWLVLDAHLTPTTLLHLPGGTFLTVWSFLVDNRPGFSSPQFLEELFPCPSATVCTCFDHLPPQLLSCHPLGFLISPSCLPLSI